MDNQLAQVDLTILLLTLNEADNLAMLLPRIQKSLSINGLSYEIIVIDAHSTDDTVGVATRYGALAVQQHTIGYGSALLEGFSLATGRYILTLDADLSHDPAHISRLWNARENADVVIASRFCSGGTTQAPIVRSLLSRCLNWSYARVLNIPIADMSSGFRLYSAECVKSRVFRGAGFEILEEVLASIYLAGGRVVELPFTYLPRAHGTSKAKIIRFGTRILITLITIRVNRSRMTSPSNTHSHSDL
jgi:glycosyltransferase involved in cell wall biosynthesis